MQLYMAPKEKPTGTPHSDDSDLDGCDQQKEKVGEGEEKLTTQEREKLRLKGNKKWSDYRLQIDRMVEKWVGFFPRARLLVAGVGPGRDFFFFPRGECKEFSRLQLRRMEAWLKSMMKSKEERELLLEAFDEARDKATLISQLKATNGSIHYQGGNNNRDAALHGTQGRGGQRKIFEAAVQNVMEADTMVEMDMMIKELEQDWAAYRGLKTFDDALVKLKVAREKKRERGGQKRKC